MNEEPESQDVKPYVFVCIECQSTQRINPFTDVWVQEGQTPPCKSCGGVVIYLDADTPEDLSRELSIALKQANRQRGVPST